MANVSTAPTSTSNCDLKDRKAASQRRYYQRNKLKEQEKARTRASIKRSQARLVQCALSPSPLPPTHGSTPPSPPTHSPTPPLSPLRGPTPPLSPIPGSTPPSPPTHGPTPPSSPTHGHTSSSPSSASRSSPLSFSAATPPLPHSPVSSYTSDSENATDDLESVQGVPAEVYLWWPSWSARRHISGLRRWMLDVEWKEGEFSTWNTNFMSNWANHRASDAGEVKEWAEVYLQKIHIGRLILQYLSRVMDGQLLGGLAPCELTLQEECRDLSLQIHQLSTPVSSAVAGLEVSLKWIQI